VGRCGSKAEVRERPRRERCGYSRPRREPV
jgi:hypothetical protein